MVQYFVFKLNNGLCMECNFNLFVKCMYSYILYLVFFIYVFWFFYFFLYLIVILCFDFVILLNVVKVCNDWNIDMLIMCVIVC